MVDYSNESKLGIYPGKGISAKLDDCDEYLDFTVPMGKASAVYLGMISQLNKWGFKTFKMDEWTFVTPLMKPYYDMIIGEKDKLLAQIKTGLASIAQTAADLELILHDLRKYEQYLNYFNQIKKGEYLIKQGKKEEGEKMKRGAEQILRSIFIDEVDIHTDLPNTPIALRSIAGRWPTIISDFMKLDKEQTPEEIKLDVSNAEKVILATKNKLFLEWLSMFEKTVKDRYARLRELAESRKKTMVEYKEALKPTIIRYKMINDSLSGSMRNVFYTNPTFHPEAQAVSLDYMLVWAFKPFAPEEKYKISREQFDKVSLKKAGFTDEEINELAKYGIKGDVDALPIEPSIDEVVRKIASLVQKEHSVKITIKDIYEARNRLVSYYKSRSSGIGPGEVWVFSPYFIFLEIPASKSSFKFPDGSQAEGLTLSNIRAYLQTQNVIIGRILEVIAREKELDNYLLQMLGEVGVKEKISTGIKNLLSEEFPSVYSEEKTKESKSVKKFSFNFDDFVKKLIPAFIRARGPYEFAIAERLTKYYFKPTGQAFGQVISFLKSSFGVP